MAYLNLALYAEGPTDYRLLTPLLRRLTEDLCLREARAMVEVADIVGVDAPRKFHDEDRATRLLEAARGFWGGACIFFIHADGAGNRNTSIDEQVQPGVRRIRGELRGGACVAVVPVRETEAWALADGGALREAFGTTLDDGALRIPKKPRDVEGIDDPKRVLDEAFSAVITPSRRRRSKASDFFERIGERADLAVLELVPSFALMKEDLRRALQTLGLIANDPR